MEESVYSLAAVQQMVTAAYILGFSDAHKMGDLDVFDDHERTELLRIARRDAVGELWHLFAPEPAEPAFAVPRALGLSWALASR